MFGDVVVVKKFVHSLCARGYVYFVSDFSAAYFGSSECSNMHCSDFCTLF